MILESFHYNLLTQPKGDRRMIQSNQSHQSQTIRTKALLLAGFFAVFAGFQAPASAQEITAAPEMQNPDYYEIGEVSVEEAEVQDVELSTSSNYPRVVRESSAAHQSLSLAGINPEIIVNLGKLFWEVIKYNAPVAHFHHQTASALPRGVTGWEALDGWQEPRVRAYRVQYKNKLGVSVVDFTYTIRYTYGGNIRGIGQYLANIMVEPRVKVAAGWKFDGQGRVGGVLNAGTREAPMARMELIVDWKVNSLLSAARDSQVYLVDGNGSFQNVALSSSNTRN